MLEKCFKPKARARFSKRRGQVSMLFALLMPIFILFIGVTLDLGWYYLNVSRLQNAADAAAVAGAQTLISEGQNFSDYKNIVLVKKYPVGVSNEYRTDTPSEKEAITSSNNVAKKYVNKNLSGESQSSLVDSWTKREIQAEEPKLYEKDDNLYYVVKLSEEIRHFFLPGWFDDMSAPVTAVAMLSKNVQDTPTPPEMSDVSETILPQVPEMPARSPTVITDEEGFEEAVEGAKNSNVIVGNWEVQKKYITIDGTKTYTDEATGREVYVLALASDFENRFGFAVYTSAWNHFQDKKIITKSTEPLIARKP